MPETAEEDDGDDDKDIVDDGEDDDGEDEKTLEDQKSQLQCSLLVWAGGRDIVVWKIRHKLSFKICEPELVIWIYSVLIVCISDH